MIRSTCLRFVPRASAGFTLVEAMFAVVLLSTGLLGVAALVSVAVQTWRRAGEMTAAVVAVGEIADSFRVFGVSGGGGRQYPWGTVAWDDPVPVDGWLLRVGIRASTLDSTEGELLRVAATVRVR